MPPLSPEHRAAISATKRARGISPAQRAANQRRRGVRLPGHGVKVSAGLTGHRQSVEHRAAIGRAHGGTGRVYPTTFDRKVANRGAGSGLTADQIRELHVLQDGRCAGCGVEMPAFGPHAFAMLVLDHRHGRRAGSVREVRGLLCNRLCNMRVLSLVDSLGWAEFDRIVENLRRYDADPPARRLFQNGSAPE